MVKVRLPREPYEGQIYYKYGSSWPKIQKEYSEFIKNNFKLVPLEEK